ncbi:unnamed protein product [Gadus morhua 'NCC']
MDSTSAPRLGSALVEDSSPPPQAPHPRPLWPIEHLSFSCKSGEVRKRGSAGLILGLLQKHPRGVWVEARSPPSLAHLIPRIRAGFWVFQREPQRLRVKRYFARLKRAACLDPALFSCTFSPPSPHLLLTFSPPSPHLLPTFSPPSPHLLPHLLLTFSPPSPHLLLTFSPPSPHFSHLLLTFLLTFSPPSPTFYPPSPHLSPHSILPASLFLHVPRGTSTGSLGA